MRTYATAMNECQLDENVSARSDSTVRGAQRFCPGRMVRIMGGMFEGLTGTVRDVGRDGRLLITPRGFSDSGVLLEIGREAVAAMG